MNNSNAKKNKPKGPNYLNEEFSPQLRQTAKELLGSMPKNLYGQPPQPSYGQFNVNNPYSQLAQLAYGQPPQPMQPMQPPQSFAEVVSHPPEPSYEYPPPVSFLPRVPLNSLTGGSTYTGPFGLNATLPHIPNPEGILTGIEGGPVQVYSPFPPPGGPTTYKRLIPAVNPRTGNTTYYKNGKKGGRKTRTRRKRSKTRRN